jgi:hypothetical protein
MKDFTEGRTNKAAYRVFYTQFVPAVVGPDLFQQRIQDDKSKDPCTASDEAFTLLLLENNYDRWLDIFNKTDGNPAQRRGHRTKFCESDIETKYTSGGIKFSNDKEAPKAKGWSEEGIQRFNLLFKSVKDDRQLRPRFIRRLIKKQAEEPKIKAQKKKSPAIQAANSLWDDENTTEHKSGDSSDENNEEGSASDESVE